jgi:hypothetical protein
MGKDNENELDPNESAAASSDRAPMSQHCSPYRARASSSMDRSTIRPSIEKVSTNDNVHIVPIRRATARDNDRHFAMTNTWLAVIESMEIGAAFNRVVSR